MLVVEGTRMPNVRDNSVQNLAWKRNHARPSNTSRVFLEAMLEHPISIRLRDLGKLRGELFGCLAESGGVASLNCKLAGRERVVCLRVDMGEDVSGNADSEDLFVVLDDVYCFACFVSEPAGMECLVFNALLQEAIAFRHGSVGSDCEFFRGHLCSVIEA